MISVKNNHRTLSVFLVVRIRCAVLEFIQFKAQATLQTGWNILLLSVNKELRLWSGSSLLEIEEQLQNYWVYNNSKNRM